MAYISKQQVQVSTCNIINSAEFNHQTFILTHSYLEIYLSSVVWTHYTYENIFENKHNFAKYLKESSR